MTPWCWPGDRAPVLGHPNTTRDNLQRALRIYDEIRLTMAHRVMDKTRMNGRYYSFGLDIEQLSPNQQWEFLQRMGWEWDLWGSRMGLFGARNISCDWILLISQAWTTTVDDAVEEALRRLRRS